jgi:hypothetical protein
MSIQEMFFIGVLITIFVALLLLARFLRKKQEK